MAPPSAVHSSQRHYNRPEDNSPEKLFPRSFADAARKAPEEAFDFSLKSSIDSSTQDGDPTPQDLSSPTYRKSDMSPRDEKRSSDMVPDIDSPSSSPSPTPKSILKNGTSAKPRKNPLVEVRYSNGDGLMSVREDRDYKDALEQGNVERPVPKGDQSRELVSGRRAGAGWERSGYVLRSRISPVFN